MKTRILAVMLLLFSCVVLQAQDIYYNSLQAQETQFRVALTVGYNQSKVIHDRARGTSSNSLYGGAILDWLWSDNLSLQTGLLFVPKGYESYTRFEGSSKFDYTLRAYYVEIPLTATYYFPVSKDIKFFVDAGLYYAVGLFGKIRLNMKEWDRVEDTFGKKKDLEQWEHFDLGFQCGAGFEFFDRVKLRLGYEQGLVKMLRNDDRAQYNKMFGLTLGYYI